MAQNHIAGFLMSWVICQCTALSVSDKNLILCSFLYIRLVVAFYKVGSWDQNYNASLKLSTTLVKH